jgi:hypothetical protein
LEPDHRSAAQSRDRKEAGFGSGDEVRREAKACLRIPLVNPFERSARKGIVTPEMVRAAQRECATQGFICLNKMAWEHPND